MYKRLHTFNFYRLPNLEHDTEEYRSSRGKFNRTRANMPHLHLSFNKKFSVSELI
jgi:hypothetical protein